MFGSERAELSHYGYSCGNNEIIITYNAVRVLSFVCKEIGPYSSECGTGGKTMLQEIYFVDAVAGKRPPSPRCDFPNFTLADRQLRNLPKELVLGYTCLNMCCRRWTVEKEKLPLVMAHIYPRGAEHYDHSGRCWDWKAITDSMTGPTVCIEEWED